MSGSNSTLFTSVCQTPSVASRADWLPKLYRLASAVLITWFTNSAEPGELASSATTYQGGERIHGIPKAAIDVQTTKSGPSAKNIVLLGLECQKCPCSLTTRIENTAKWKTSGR